MIGWLFGISWRRPVLIRRRIVYRRTRRWWRQHRRHGISTRTGLHGRTLWWCRRCRVGHYPHSRTRWRVN